MSDSRATVHHSPSPSTGHRLGIPIVIAGLALLGAVIIRAQPEMEHNFKNWATSGVFLLAVLLGLLWFLLLSRVRWQVRVSTLGVLVVSIFGLTRLLRVDGTADGSGLPKFVWRWTKTHQAPLALPTVGNAANTTPGTTLAGATDVPQYFGPHRDGVIKNAGLSHDWTSTPPKQLWRQPIGAGWSAFAVVGDRAYTQEQRGENECVTCYDLATGRLIWTHTNAVHFSQWQGGDGPRATPTVDQGRVFAFGATGILDCLDATTGQAVWSRDVLKENNLANLMWGVSASPLVFEDTVVVTGGLTNGPTLIAYRRSTGEPLWTSGTDKASYASPALATLAGRQVVLSFNAGTLTAHDPKTGEILLSYPWADDKWPKASQPVVLEGSRVFISAGYGAGCGLLEIEAGPNGKLIANQVWKSLRMKTQFNSVAAKDGYLYGLDDGLLACVDIATGDRKWKDGRYGSGQTLLVDDLILIQTEPGAVVLAEAQPTGFHELGRIPALTAKTWTHPTLAGRYLLVRNSEEMACYELPVQAENKVAAAR